MDFSKREEVNAREEKFAELFKGEIRSDIPALMTHFASMAIDDLIQVEHCAIYPDHSEYAQVMIRGAGIGHLLKAGLIMKNQ
jgi:hypothetical protein